MSLLVILLYFIIGSLLIFTSFIEHLIPENVRKMLGIVSIAYGVLRSVRIYSKRTKNDEYD
jgi:hypothetical protein